jgi:hydroxymethylbilane synthase
VRSGELDGVVVAAAGLARLGRLAEATELLDPLQMLSAPAQGALAVECRAQDLELGRALAAVLDDEATRAAVVAERAVLATLEAGCSAPVGALADVVSDLDDDGNAVDRLSLRAVVGTIDGALLRASVTGDMDDAEKLGAALAAELLDMGGLDALPRNAGSGVPR